MIHPNDKEPVSPIKILAGGALYQRNPKQDPTIEPQILLPQHPECVHWGENEKIVFPTTYEISVKDK